MRLDNPATTPLVTSGVIVAEILVRPCRATDLPGLEWFGLYRHHREIFEEFFARHLRGDNIMLVAELNNFPVGQAWVDLAKHRIERVGYIWAVRVFPVLRNLGIGTLLMSSAEDVLRERNIQDAEVGVEKTNPAARRLYERLGYLMISELIEDYEYATPEGERCRHRIDQWILRKRLEPTLSVSRT